MSSIGVLQRQTLGEVFNASKGRQSISPPPSTSRLFFPHGEFQFLEFAGAVLPAWGVSVLGVCWSKPVVKSIYGCPSRHGEFQFLEFAGVNQWSNHLIGCPSRMGSFSSSSLLE
eukprot:scaffold17356_cov67-Skeletonema_dohrnii-CCMP3373.AAC.2